MGTSGNQRVSYSEYISALLISFTKIKVFSEFFKYQNDKEKILSNIFNSLVNNNFSDEAFLGFNKFLSQNFKNIKNISINEIINFILSKLHEENNELKNNISSSIIKQSQNIDINNENQVYNYFLNYYRTNKSIIQDLFYREDEIISICSKCKNTFYIFNLEKIIHFNMSQYYNKEKLKNLTLLDLLKQREDKTKKNSFCEKCNKTIKMTTSLNFKKLPEIFIISFGDINYNKPLDYYLNMNYGDEKYILIGIIINKDENNEDSNNYNVFYRDYHSNNKWYIYDINKKEKKGIKEIMTISQNPLVCYYQRKLTYIKIFVNKLYNQLYILYNDFINLSKARGYNEAKSYIEAIYRGLTYNNFLNSYYKEIKDLYLLLDEKVNRHYLSKPSQSQIEVVSNIRKYLLKLFKTNQFDFSKLSKAYYTGYGTLAEDLFSEIDLIIKSGPCFNDGFDRDFYNSLSRTDKIKYAYNFFLTLYQRGELYLSTNNHRHLIKMLTIVEKLSELQSKEEKTHQRER